jgi:hypothetical protein
MEKQACFSISLFKIAADELLQKLVPVEPAD